jgi:hypothetical protein
MRDKTRHGGTCLEYSPSAAYMEKERKGGVSEYGMMPLQFRASLGLRSFLCYGDEQWTSRATSIPDAEVPSRRNDELATDLADESMSHGFLLWRSSSTCPLINI